ncbi:zinc ABC transporter substrate-binding protein [Corynebacterium felinum]|uniref:Zinc/manganese transport system substrate-binding protein n=1 Tax=Corynebacterium felinum TaxID=131318 RepID=A0ABU2B595_9CORY|nr:zinc ABC transporter substrate-binding protein [Corynebacterium felinum]MDF5821216.1 zinc ABC transporter substrate-binding protein [Corynebacterium felinum]MDR7353783.1 zinc/manganese transport system substrate-binding protein [Corynebacterium felinum]WJY95962.1 high-affinity zinc transporter periplasmic component [Corynebacterium felinum]
MNIRSLPLALVLATSTLVATACSPSTPTQVLNPTPGATLIAKEISIVTSTSVWGEIAREVGKVATGVQVHVTPIISGTNQDPHTFEPTAKDLAQAHEADIVVVGGGGYDAWLYKNIKEDKIIHALPLEDHDHEHKHSDESNVPGIANNEHIWFDPLAVEQVASALATAITDISPHATVDLDGFLKSLDDIHERLHRLPTRSIAQTEPIADYLIAYTPMQEITPAHYRSATLSEREPTAADVAKFLEVIMSGELDILIHNPQTSTDLTRRLVDVALDCGVKVVEVYETPAEGETYLEFLTHTIDRLSA